MWTRCPALSFGSVQFYLLGVKRFTRSTGQRGHQKVRDRDMQGKCPTIATDGVMTLFASAEPLCRLLLEASLLMSALLLPVGWRCTKFGWMRAGVGFLSFCLKLWHLLGLSSPALGKATMRTPTNFTNCHTNKIQIALSPWLSSSTYVAGQWETVCLYPRRVLKS